MELKKVWAVYFSGTGTTRSTVERIAHVIAGKLDLPMERVDFSVPSVRQRAQRFNAALIDYKANIFYFFKRNVLFNI